jgi:sucrose phosphorylase
MTSSIRDKLRFLYPGREDETNNLLRGMITDFKARYSPARARSPFFSEKDAVLICYADHVREPGVATLKTLRRFLDEYVRESIPAVHLLPFYPYSSDDGFSIVDYFRVQDGFGDWDDVDNIAEEYDLMVDLVINHVSAQSEWFRGFLEGDLAYSDYIIAFERPVDVSSVFRPRTHPLLTRFDTARGERHVWTTFSEDQIDVNFSNPNVLLEYLRILLFYVEHGATIIRLDAIAFLWKELGTRSLHLPQTHMVVKLLRQVLEEVAPNVWIITETNVPHEENISYFGAGDDEAHLVYNFALPPLLMYSFLQGDATQLSRWARSLSPPSQKTAFFNFTASHDGIGVTALREMISASEFRSVLTTVQQRGGRVSHRSVPGQEPIPYELNIVYLNALGGPAPFIASQAIALSLQGVPGIYFGSLIGAENWGEGVEMLGYNRAINRQKFSYNPLTAELDDPSSTKHQVFSAYTKLLLVRSREPLFSPHAAQTILDLHPSIFAAVRSYGSDSLLVLVNVSDREIRLDATPLPNYLQGGAIVDLLTGRKMDVSGGVTLAPYASRWLKAHGSRLTAHGSD